MAQLAIIRHISRQVSSSSAGDYQAEEHAGIGRLSWRTSSRGAGRCHAAQFLIIKQMNRQVSRDSAGDNQIDEQTGVARVSCRL